MKSNLKDILQTLEKERLSSNKKAFIRSVLEDAIDGHVFVGEQPSRQPFSIKTMYVYVRKHLAPTIAGIMIFAFGVTSVAAESSLPGDLLYPIKVNINESIGDAFAISTKSQAEWDSRVAERRVEEAVNLFTQGELTPEAQQGIVKSFEQRTNKADALLVRIADDGDTDIAINGRTDMEARLRAHSELLGELTSAAQDPSVARDILSLINSRIIVTSEKRLKVETKVLTQKKDQLKVSAESKHKLAEQKLKSVQKVLRKNINDDESDLFFKTKDRISLAEQIITVGTEAFEREEYDVAYNNFQESISLSQEIETYVHTFGSLKFKNTEVYKDDEEEYVDTDEVQKTDEEIEKEESDNAEDSDSLETQDVFERLDVRNSQEARQDNQGVQVDVQTGTGIQVNF